MFCVAQAPAQCSCVCITNSLCEPLLYRQGQGVGASLVSEQLKSEPCPVPPGACTLSPWAMASGPVLVGSAKKALWR
jgi:hypothetical protein